MRRRRGLAVLGLASVVAVALAAQLLSSGAASPTSVELRLAGTRSVSVRVAGLNGHPLPPAKIRREVRRALPAKSTARRGKARITFQIDREAAARAAADRPAPATIDLRATPIASSIEAPIVGQRLRNNCETAALQVLLATLGVRADQLVLQRQIAVEAPRDPVGAPPDMVWGDPDRGYVGRADGTGPSGGFGVYPAPVAKLAARLGRPLDNLSGSSPATIYRRLLIGRAVLAWVGLEDGPYESWRTRSGRAIRANFNEHTVVLTGMRPGGSLDVVNVLKGTREIWSRRVFEAKFNLLGRRALAAPAAPRA